MKTLYLLAANKRTSRLIFLGLAFFVIISNHILPDSASPEENDLMLYLAFGLTIIWAVIYNLVPKQETFDELKKRHQQTVWVILIAVLAFIGVQLYDQIYFLPKVKARVQEAQQKAREQDAQRNR